MKKISYLCSTYLISCATLAYANIFSPDTHLSVYTKSTTSVAESSDFIKLAAVYPLSGNGGMTFKAPKATSCAAGYESYNGKCIKKCDRKTYPFASQPSTVKGTFSSCTGLTTYYGYTACNNGWSLSNHDCIENTCDGYVPQANLSHCQTAGGNICYRGSTAVYKCSTCDAGWVLNASGICVEKSCSSDDYPYPSNPGEDAGKVKSCQSGERTWYGYESCNSGWVKSGSYCNKVKCDTTAYPYTTQGQAAGCKSIQECKSGSDSYYGCGSSGCKSGYIADGKQCMLCSWDDNALDACPEHGVCTSKTCGGTTKYTLNSCEGGESTQLTCNVGDIYYSDDTCNSVRVNSKTPIGVVFDAVNNLVVSLNETTATWGGYGTDVPQLENFGSGDIGRDVNGKSNTNILLAYGEENNIEFSAAQYCHDMSTGGKTWYLPAVGEMQPMYTGYSTFNDKLAAAGGIRLSNNLYWSSSEQDNVYAWSLNPVEGNMFEYKAYDHPVRCIFSYAEGTTTTYVKQGNTCVIDTPSCSLDGYDLASCPANATCESKTCGATTKYKMTGCQNGYKENNGSCQKMNIFENCQVGEIAYSDGTCDTKIVSGKTPIGVVFEVDKGSHIVKIVGVYDIDHNGAERIGQVPPGPSFALWIDTSLVWSYRCGYSTLDGHDEPCPESSDSSLYDEHYLPEILTVSLSADDGQYNTDLLMDLAESVNINPVAAKATRLYQPQACAADSFCGKGKWSLPAIDEITKARNIANDSLKLIDNRTFHMSPNSRIILSDGSYMEGEGWDFDYAAMNGNNICYLSSTLGNETSYKDMEYMMTQSGVRAIGGLCFESIGAIFYDGSWSALRPILVVNTEQNNTTNSCHSVCIKSPYPNCNRPHSTSVAYTNKCGDTCYYCKEQDSVVTVKSYCHRQRIGISDPVYTWDGGVTTIYEYEDGTMTSETQTCGTTYSEEGCISCLRDNYLIDVGVNESYSKKGHIYTKN